MYKFLFNIQNNVIYFIEIKIIRFYEIYYEVPICNISHFNKVAMSRDRIYLHGMK